MSRYLRRKKPTREKWRVWTIRQVVARDGGECYLCHQAFNSKSDITLDHLIPISKGGTDGLGNMRLAHNNCNRDKKDMTIEEYAVMNEGL